MDELHVAVSKLTNCIDPDTRVTEFARKNSSEVVHRGFRSLIGWLMCRRIRHHRPNGRDVDDTPRIRGLCEEMQNRSGEVEWRLDVDLERL